MLIRRSLRSAAAPALVVIALAVFGPAAALGDSPTNGQLLVPGDHHLPGATIEITGYGLDPGMALELTLVHGSRAAPLAMVSVLTDGTFSTPAVIPATYPTGYAQVVGTNSGAGNWATTILVGERAEGPDASGIRVDGEGPYVDVTSIGFLMVVVGLIVFAGAALRYLRGRPNGAGRPS